MAGAAPNGISSPVAPGRPVDPASAEQVLSGVFASAAQPAKTLALVALAPGGIESADHCFVAVQPERALVLKQYGMAGRVTWQPEMS